MGAAERKVQEHAQLVIGADGRNSLVAKAVGSKKYNVRPALTVVTMPITRVSLRMFLVSIRSLAGC
jgi:2-polyprenyl-6-methoxyphenol hydroxylase-like FAD-dependent oxidoreductase